MSDYTRIAYAPARDTIHLWEVQQDGEKEHLFVCDEVCSDGYCLGPDDFSSEREVSVRDLVVERQGGTVTVKLVDVAAEPDE